MLSCSSNGFPDLEQLLALLAKYKRDITVHQAEHRYHFGTHSGVAAARTVVDEYLIVGV